MQVDSSSDQFQLLWSRRDKCTCAWLNSVRNWPTAPGISITVRVLMCTETCRIPILYCQRRLSPGMENCWSCAIHVEHRCEGESNINCKHLEECPMRCSGRIFTSLRGRFQPRALWCTESNDFLPALSLINKTLLSIYLYLISPALRVMGACRNLCQLS